MNKSAEAVDGERVEDRGIDPLKTEGRMQDGGKKEEFPLGVRLM